jgi:hypothetical protein
LTIQPAGSRGLDEERPVTLSHRAIPMLLRDELAFDGVVSGPTVYGAATRLSRLFSAFAIPTPC